MQYFEHEIKVNDQSVALSAYIPDAAPHANFQTDRPAVIVLPGGGYKGRYGGEAEPIVLRYVGHGACAFLLHYSVYPAVFPQALLEVLNAVKYVRDNAERFGVDPEKIAICGFSAGGHLACSAGVFWNHACIDGMLEGDRTLYRPNKMILCYPVTTYKSHHGSYKNLLTGAGEEMTEERIDMVSVEKHVSEDAPAAYIWHNYDDKGVSVGETFLFAKALYDHQVPVEMRIYPTGGHGTCLGNYITKGLAFDERKPCEGWVEDTIPFLFR
jgi:acetyl esterase/lipase